MLAVSNEQVFEGLIGIKRVLMHVDKQDLGVDTVLIVAKTGVS
jgi:hypothetical protein